MTFKPTVQQAARLHGTKAADATGRPLVLHHGTVHQFDRFSRTDDIGFHFGSRAQALARLDQLTDQEVNARGAGSPRIVSVALAIRNPIVLPDDPVAWNGRHVSNLFRRFLTRSERADVARIDRMGLPPAKFDKALLARVREALIRHGHDGVVYRNVIEREFRKALEWSWLALKPESVVILGEDLQLSRLPIPAGVVPIAGIDPLDTVRSLGGLRNRYRKIASKSDLSRFTDLVDQAVARVLPGRDITWNRYSHSMMRDSKLETPNGDIVLTVIDDQARLIIKPPKQDVDDDKFTDLVADGSLQRVFLLDPGESLYDACWQPGEPAETVVSEFEHILSVIMERMSVPEPNAGPTGP